MEKLTTVVIPNYNGMKYLENCLSFLHRSKDTQFDTIVVDNGSEDDSVGYIKRQFEWVKIIQMGENTGFSKAVNAGIKASQTKYVLLLNNDTIVDYHFVYELERMMEENSKLFSCGAKMLSMSDTQVIDDAGDFYTALGWAYARGKGQSAERYTKPDYIFSACAGAAIYRREVFDKIGLFDEAHFAYLEDIDVGYRSRIYGYQNRFCPKAIVYHAGSGSSGSRYNEFKIKLSSRNSIYLISKNMPFLQILINFPLLFCGFAIKTLFFVRKKYAGVYVRGLTEGFKMSFSPEGRAQKVPFYTRNIWRYFVIEWELLRNIFGLIR